jgi:hypothetical protein
MMVGGSNTHTIIKDNVVTALRAHLRGQPCRAFGEGPKVVTATATMYPNAIVVSGPIDLAEDQVRARTVVGRAALTLDGGSCPRRQMGSAALVAEAVATAKGGRRSRRHL